MISSAQQLKNALDVHKFMSSRAKKAPERGQAGETISENAFIRKFGAKPKKIVRSGRLDMIGLIVLGDSTGFVVTRDGDGRAVKKLYLFRGQYRLMPDPPLPLKSGDSLSNLCQGLLNWVT